MNEQLGFDGECLRNILGEGHCGSDRMLAAQATVSGECELKNVLLMRTSMCVQIEMFVIMINLQVATWVNWLI